MIWSQIYNHNIQSLHNKMLIHDIYTGILPIRLTNRHDGLTNHKNVNRVILNEGIPQWCPTNYLHKNVHLTHMYIKGHVDFKV